MEDSKVTLACPLQTKSIYVAPVRGLSHLISLWELTPLCWTHSHFLIRVVRLGEVGARGGRGRGLPALWILFIHLLSLVRVLFVLRSALSI